MIARHLDIPLYQLGIDIAFSRFSTRVRTALCPHFPTTYTRAKRHLGHSPVCSDPLAGPPHAEASVPANFQSQKPFRHRTSGPATKESASDSCTHCVLTTSNRHTL